jgi:hypothetical protein
MRIQSKTIALCWKQQRGNGWRGAWEDVWHVIPLHLSPKLLGLSKFPVRLLIQCIQSVIIFIRGSQHHVLCLTFTTGGSATERRCHTYNGMRCCSTTHRFLPVNVTWQKEPTYCCSSVTWKRSVQVIFSILSQRRALNLSMSFLSAITISQHRNTWHTPGVFEFCRSADWHCPGAHIWH